MDDICVGSGVYGGLPVPAEARVDLTTVVEQGRKPVEMSGEWRIWKREYWRDFKPIKPVLNLTVVLAR